MTSLLRSTECKIQNLLNWYYSIILTRGIENRHGCCHAGFCIVLCVFPCGFRVAEQKRDTPYGGQTNQGIDDPADGAVGAAADEGDQVETKDADGTPVQTANDGQDQSNFVDKHACFLLTLVLRIVCTLKGETCVGKFYRPKYSRRHCSVSAPGSMGLDSTI